jgi:hypothetical protein
MKEQFLMGSDFSLIKRPKEAPNPTSIEQKKIGNCLKKLLMKKKYPTLTLLVWGLFSASVLAQPLTGCGKAGTVTIYYQQNGFGSGLNFLKPKYEGAFSTLTSNTSVCPRFTSAAIHNPTTLCCIGTDCAVNNYLYDFTNIACPLDENSLFLFFLTAITGIYAIRRYSSALSKP